MYVHTVFQIQYGYNNYRFEANILLINLPTTIRIPGYSWVLKRLFRNLMELKFRCILYLFLSVSYILLAIVCDILQHLGLLKILFLFSFFSVGNSSENQIVENAAVFVSEYIVVVKDDINCNFISRFY